MYLRLRVARRATRLDGSRRRRGVFQRCGPRQRRPAKTPVLCLRLSGRFGSGPAQCLIRVRSTPGWPWGGVLCRDIAAEPPDSNLVYGCVRRLNVVQGPLTCPRRSCHGACVLAAQNPPSAPGVSPRESYPAEKVDLLSIVTGSPGQRGVGTHRSCAHVIDTLQFTEMTPSSQLSTTGCS